MTSSSGCYKKQVVLNYFNSNNYLNWAHIELIIRTDCYIFISQGIFSDLHISTSWINKYLMDTMEVELSREVKSKSAWHLAVQQLLLAWEPTPKGKVPTYYSVKFSWKLLGNETNRAGGGASEICLCRSAADQWMTSNWVKKWILPMYSIGSSDRVGAGRGCQETWNLSGRLWRPPFLWLIFTGPGGGHGVLAPPQDMLLMLWSPCPPPDMLLM